MVTFRIASLALGLLVSSHLLAAAPPDRTDWANVVALSPGTALKLRVASPATPGKPARLKGKLLAVTGSTLTVQLRNGATQTIPQATVRQLLATGGKRRHAPLIGAAAGAAAVATLASRPRFDLVSSAVVLAAAAGAAAGYGLGKGFQYSLIYQAP